MKDISTTDLMLELVKRDDIEFWFTEFMEKIPTQELVRELENRENVKMFSIGVNVGITEFKVRTPVTVLKIYPIEEQMNLFE